jgi:hypothetical protein
MSGAKVTVTRLRTSDFGKVDLVPQAIIGWSIRDFEREAALYFDREEDDLAQYHVAYFRTPVGVAALIHHDGESEDGMTLYFPRNLTSQEIGLGIAEILKTFKVPESFISWRESMDLRR